MFRQERDRETLRNWAPHFGKLTIGDTAACAAGMEFLAQSLAKLPGRFGGASLCARIAFWLHRELDKVAPAADLLVTDQTTLPLPPQLVDAADDIRRFADDLEASSLPYAGLWELCVRLLVASGDPKTAPDALLELGDAALRRGEQDGEDNLEVARDCYEELLDAPESEVKRDFRVMALFGAAQAHIALGKAEYRDMERVVEDWVLARERLLAITDDDLDRSRGLIGREEVTQLLTTVINLISQAEIDIAGSAQQEVGGL